MLIIMIIKQQVYLLQIFFNLIIINIKQLYFKYLIFISQVL